jgi:hypothetical protein
LTQVADAQVDLRAAKDNENVHAATIVAAPWAQRAEPFEELLTMPATNGSM